MTKPSYPLLHVEEILTILKKIAVFGGLNDFQLYEIFKLLKTVSYNEGELIYQCGEAPSHIYIVKQGEVKVILNAQNVVLELLSFSVGDCFGEDSVIGIQAHSSGALAVAPTELIVLERQALLNIYETDKELFGMLILNIARETARKLHKADEALARYMLNK
jgi:CRP-like cAMP-binding protein